MLLNLRLTVVVVCLSGTTVFCFWTMREGDKGGITPVIGETKGSKARRGRLLTPSLADTQKIHSGTIEFGRLAYGDARLQLADLPPGRIELAKEALSLLGNVGNAERQTALKFVRFIVTGRMDEIDSLGRKDVESLLQGMNDDVCCDDVALVLETFLGIPKEITLASNDPIQSLLGLFDAVKPSVEPAPPDATLVFTDHCENDGTVTGNVHVIPAGAKRVYAVFENAGNLRELDYVLAIWRDPTNKQMVFSECEPLRRATLFNYVFLELSDGWLPGKYQLDLCNPARKFEVLASQTFSVN